MRHYFYIYFYLCGLLIFPISHLSSQDNKKDSKKSQLLSKAFRHYYSNQNKLAISHFEKYIAINSRSAIALRYLGILYFKTGNLNQAIRTLQQAIHIKPDDLSSLEILGQIYLNTGKFNQAEIIYLKILEINPLEENALEVLARIYENKKNVRKSISYYKRLHIAARKNFSVESLQHALQKLGRYYYDRQNHPKAIEYFEKLYELDKNNISSSYVLASLYKLQGRIQDSIEHYKNVLKIQPGHKTSRYELVENYYLIGHVRTRAETNQFLAKYKQIPDMIKAISAELNGDLEGAEYSFRLVLKKRPNLLSARIGMVKVYIKLNDYENLKKEMFIIVHLAQRVHAFQIARQYGITLLKILDKEAAEIDFKSIFTAPSKNKKNILSDEVKELATNYIDIYSAHARTMENLEFKKSAISYYDKSVSYINYLKKWYQKNDKFSKQLNKKKYQLLASSAWLLHQKPIEKFDESIRVIKKAIKLFPKNSRGEFLTGIIYYVRGDKNKKFYKKAIPHLNKAINLILEEKAPANYFFYLGASLDKINKFGKAEKALKRAIQLEPDNSSYLNYLGYLYSLRGIKYTEASKLLFRALEDDPENEAYLDSLGWLFYKTGKYDQALEQLLMAVDQAEKRNNIDSIIYYHLAETYDKLKEYSQAYIYFKKTLDQKKLASEPIDEKYIKKKLKQLKKKQTP